MIIPMLLPGHNTKKKYWPKSPWLKKHPKMPKNANFGAYFDHFLTNFCHLDGLHSAENLGGIAQSFDMFLFKIWKNITFLTQECTELHVLNISQTPSNASRMPEGWWKPKSCLTFVAKYCIFVCVTAIKLVSDKIHASLFFTSRCIFIVPVSIYLAAGPSQVEGGWGEGFSPPPPS